MGNMGLSRRPNVAGIVIMDLELSPLADGRHEDFSVMQSLLDISLL
jgi:hypothetical protein